MNLDETVPPRNTGLDQADFTELLRTIRNIGGFFRSVLSPPHNAEVSPSRRILARVGTAASSWGVKTTTNKLPERHPLKEWPSGKGPVRAELLLRIYRPVYQQRNPSTLVRIQINDPWLEGRLVFEDKEGGIYLPLQPEGEKDGRLLFRVDRNTVLEKILPAGRDPWLPVSRERWVSTLIARSGETLEERRKAITGESEQRRRRFMQGYEMMKRAGAEESEKQLRIFEENERVYARQAAAIQAGDYDALEAAGDKGMAMVGRNLLELRAELSEMSAAERAAPAYGFEGNPHQYWMPRRKPRRPSLLVEPHDRDALPLLAPNHDFFRRDISTGEVQSITIINGLWKEFADLVEAQLDWAALKGVVR